MTTKFLIAYNVGEHEYTCRVDAPTWEAAERHLLALASTGRVSGEWIMDVPVQEPVAWIDITDEGQITSSPRLYKDGSREERPLYTTLPDDTALLQRIEKLERENEVLRARLEEARELVAEWGSCASAYEQEKHGLAADLAMLDAAISRSIT